jgi:hypothetical protein
VELARVYEAWALGDPPSQGGIIDDCPLFLLRGPNCTVDDEPEIVRGRVLILTQACDLTQTKATKVLVALVQETKALVAEGAVKASLIRENIRRHQVYGWYFLPSQADAVSFAESLVDLRELHTVDRRILERLIGEGKGVCRLATPYREHLNQHFAVTYMRIGLPEPYATEA